MHESDMIGVALFAELAMRGQYKKYCDNEDDIIELRRLCCIDHTEKNTESYFISRCLRWLKQNTDVRVIVSYADPNYGHSGIIYKASNFEYQGLTSKSKVINWNGKLYHDHAVRTKYKGKLKPFAKQLKNALESGEAIMETKQAKHIFTYTINRKKQVVQSTFINFQNQGVTG